MTLEKFHEWYVFLERIRLISFSVGKEITQNRCHHLNLTIRINLVRPRGNIFLYWGHKAVDYIAHAISGASFLLCFFAQIFHVPLFIVEYQYSPTRYLGLWLESSTPDSFHFHPPPSIDPKYQFWGPSPSSGGLESSLSSLPHISCPLALIGSCSTFWEQGCLLTGCFFFLILV